MVLRDRLKSDTNRPTEDGPTLRIGPTFGLSCLLISSSAFIRVNPWLFSKTRLTHESGLDESAESSECSGAQRCRRTSKQGMNLHCLKS